jgi:hypothetical protein
LAYSRTNDGIDFSSLLSFCKGLFIDPNYNHTIKQQEVKNEKNPFIAFFLAGDGVGPDIGFTCIRGRVHLRGHTKG